MSAAVIAFLLLEVERTEKVKKRILRDCSNTLDFLRQHLYHITDLNKDAFCMVLDTVKEHLLRSRICYNLQLHCVMEIRAADAPYPGSSHDAFIWNISSARRHFFKMYESREWTSKLLGDCGYGIQPVLLKIYKDPSHNWKEYKLNMAHASARNIVKRTIGVLKS